MKQQKGEVGIKNEKNQPKMAKFEDIESEVREFIDNEFNDLRQQVEEGFTRIRQNALEELDVEFDKLISMDFQTFLLESELLKNKVGMFSDKLGSLIDLVEGEHTIMVQKKRKRHQQYQLTSSTIIQKYLQYKCSICKERYEEFKDYKYHMSYLHNLEFDNNNCYVCKMQFNQPLALASHYRRRHITDGVYKCNCESFVQQDTKLIYYHLLSCLKYLKLPGTVKVKKIE